ncbi:MAG TPA: BTAD domain-containing putative transcriptional regulator [Gaiella sp.]|nr:BTAD domain-containing putative transcriptional regulator [Gaiella sp.]
MENGELRFRILGPLEVRNGEETVRLGAAKQRALLGVLLLHANETVSTSRLVDALWGERAPATAVGLVQGYVHALRKQLGASALETRAPGYRLLVEPRSLDLLEFERLTSEARAAPVVESVKLRREALALWRGPPLADVVLEGPERHELARLSELRLGTQIERIDAELRLGRHSQLVGELEALVAEHPYQELAAALLMLALYRSGRQAEALDVYRAMRTRLDNELGLQPGQQLRDLEAAILRQDDTLAAPITVREPGLAEPMPTAPEPAAVPPPRRLRLLALGGAIALLAVAAVAVAALLLRDDAPVDVPPNSVAVIDADTNRVVGSIPVGTRPGPVAAGAGFVWVGNLDDMSLSRIDPATREQVRILLQATPDAVTADGAAAWALNGRLGRLYRVDAESRLVAEQAFGHGSRSESAGVDAGEGWVWAAFGATLARVDPATLDGDAYPSTAAGATALVVAYDSVWVATAAAQVQRFSLDTFYLGPVDTPTTVGRAPSGIAAGAEAIWVACRDDDVVERIAADLVVASSRQIEVGDGPTAVAFGAGAVWVANANDGTVSRIDPETSEVVKTIEVGHAPAGIAVSGGRVWVSVQAPLTP